MFFVQDECGKSEIKRQGTGIRQGCPLSPYLFILVMHCIDHDIHEKKSQSIFNNRIPNLDFDMIYYADDTILFSTNCKDLNELLKHTEQVSALYGLNLNKDKCVSVIMNTEGTINFHDKQELARKWEAVYLGNSVNQEVNINLEISNKMQEVRRTWFKLSAYWKASNANKNGNS